MQTLRILDELRREKDYVKRNVGDLGVQLASVQEAQSANRSEIAEVLLRIMTTMDTTYKDLNGRHQLDGQGADTLGGIWKKFETSFRNRPD